MEKHIVDTKGLSCPQPVIETMNAIKKLGSGEIVVLVDTDTAKENVKRSAESKGWTVADVQAEDGGYRITITKE